MLPMGCMSPKITVNEPITLAGNNISVVLSTPTHTMSPGAMLHLLI